MNGSGSLLYPIKLFTDSYLETIPLSTIIGKVAILQSFGILFLVSTVYLVSLLVKNQMTSLFISAFMIIGPILLTGNAAPLGKLLHLLPTTYFNATRVITHQLAVENDNLNISFVTGIYVLLVSSCLIICIIVFLKKQHEIKQLFHKTK